MLKFLYRIFRLFFSEVGLITSKINYSINSIHNFKKKLVNKIYYKKYKTIKKKQFYTMGFSEIKFDKELFRKIEPNISRLINKKKIDKSFKTYWKDIFFNENKIQNDICNYLKQSELIHFAAEYFKEIPMLQSICCFHTKGDKKLKLSSSMNWHKDLHHKKLIKIMMLAQNSSKKNGPTTIIDKIDSKKIKYINYPDYFNDDEIKKQKKNIKFKELTGKKGKAYIVDTANCFHMGSRSELDRTQIIITLTPYSSNLFPFKNLNLNKSINKFNAQIIRNFM